MSEESSFPIHALSARTHMLGPTGQHQEGANTGTAMWPCPGLSYTPPAQQEFFLSLIMTEFAQVRRFAVHRKVGTAQPLTESDTVKMLGWEPWCQRKPKSSEKRHLLQRIWRHLERGSLVETWALLILLPNHPHGSPAHLVLKAPLCSPPTPSPSDMPHGERWSAM